MLITYSSKLAQPCLKEQVCLILVPVQLRGQLRPPAGGVPQPVPQLLVHQSLARHGPPVPVCYQAQGLASYPLGLMAGLVSTEKISVSLKHIFHLLRK